MVPTTLETSSARASAGSAVDVSIIIVNYNTAHLLDRVFDTIDAARANLNIEIIAVDNASSDSSVVELRDRSDIAALVENEVNVGFGRANNQALALCNGRYVLLLNTDAFVSSDTLTKTIDYMDTNLSTGVLGVKLVGPNGELQPSCRYFPTPWNSFLMRSGLARFFPHVRVVDDLAWDHASVRTCDWVPGCYYLIRREVIDAVGLFDPLYFLYFEEVDHCRAVRAAGWTVTFYPLTSVIHMGGESAKSEGALSVAGKQISPLQIESELLFFRKHHGLGGVLSWVLLCAVWDVLRASKNLVLLRTSSRTTLSHVGATLKTLVVTRFASRASR